MIIPWEVDVPQDSRPVINWLIIAGIILVFVLQMMPTAEEKQNMQERQKRFLKKMDSNNTNKQPEAEEPLPKVGMEKLVLDRFEFRGLLGHMWLHGGILHILGNLLFLWIFGNAVCSKVGNLFYLPIYLALGIWAGIAHLIFQGGAVIGASGAIMGIVGMYLVFFPRNDITCYFVWLFPFIAREFTVASYSMILYWIGFDILGAYMGGGGVAYFAHLGGFVTGFGLAVLMLKLKWVEMNPRYEESLFDVFSKKDADSEIRPFNPNYAWLRDQAVEAENKQPIMESFDAGIAAKQSDPFYHAFDTPAITEPLMPLKPIEDMIRFKCSCGRRIKIAKKYAGKTGRCPQCKNKIRVPAQ